MHAGVPGFFFLLGLLISDRSYTWTPFPAHLSLRLLLFVCMSWREGEAMAWCFSQDFAQRSSDGAELSMCRATCRNTQKNGNPVWLSTYASGMQEAEAVGGSAFEFCGIYMRKKIYSFIIADLYSSSDVYILLLHFHLMHGNTLIV